jgi:hypothetical protein
MQAVPHVEEPHIQTPPPHVITPPVQTPRSGPHIEHFQSVNPETAPSRPGPHIEHFPSTGPMTSSPAPHIQHFQQINPATPLSRSTPHLRQFQSINPQAPQEQHGITNFSSPLEGRSFVTPRQNQSQFFSNPSENKSFNHEHFSHRHHHRNNFFYPFIYFPFDSYFDSGSFDDQSSYDQQPAPPPRESVTIGEQPNQQPNSYWNSSEDELYIRNEPDTDPQQYLDQQKLNKLHQDISTLTVDQFYPQVNLPKPGSTGTK